MKFRIVRKIDSLGRIVIPKDVRESLGLKLGEEIEIYVEGDLVVIKKAEDCDSLCRP